MFLHVFGHVYMSPKKSTFDNRLGYVPLVLCWFW